MSSRGRRGSARRGTEQRPPPPNPAQQQQAQAPPSSNVFQSAPASPTPLQAASSRRGQQSRGQTPRSGTGSGQSATQTSYSSLTPSSGRPSSTETQPAAPLKVAIPRLKTPGDGRTPSGSSKGDQKHRVSHACEPCRTRKTKCSGERPNCQHCQDFSLVCVYADGKRARDKK